MVALASRFVRFEVVRRGSLLAARLRGVTAHTLALHYGPGESGSIWASQKDASLSLLRNGQTASCLPASSLSSRHERESH